MRRIREVRRMRRMCGRREGERGGDAGVRVAGRRAAGVLLAALLLLGGPAPAPAQAAGGGAGAASAAPAGGTGAGAAPAEGAAAETDAAPGFADLQGHWGRGYIEAIRQAGILTVPKDGRFRPDEAITRLDFAVWVAKAMELEPRQPATPPFVDWESLPEEARPWVAAAVEAGLLSGYPVPGAAEPARAFRPDRRVSRAEMGTIFGRALVRLGVRLETRYFYLFEDREAIPDWAEAAAASIQMQVLMGMPGYKLAKFEPARRTTRAEAAAMINRFVNARAKLLPSAPPPPPRQKPKKIVSAYYYRGSQGSYDSLSANGGALSHLYYFSYQVDAAGNLSGFPLQRDLEAARRHGLSVLAVVKNQDFSQRQASALLADPKARRRAVENIVGLMQQGFAGVNLDFESVDPADRDRYTLFVGEVAEALRSGGYLTTVALPARNARMVAQAWAQAYDYERIGRFVDWIVIMAYDQHWSGSAPGPVGGLDWADGVLAYATSVVAPEKLVLGLPAYGRDWPDPEGRALAAAGAAVNGSGAAPPGEGLQNGNGSGGNGSGGASASARAVKSRPVHDWDGNPDFYSIEELLARFAPAAEIDPATGETVLRYVNDEGVPRVAYYTDPRGLALKLDLLNKYRLGGVALWRLGFEPDGFWSVLSGLAGEGS